MRPARVGLADERLTLPLAVQGPSVYHSLYWNSVPVVGVTLSRWHSIQRSNRTTAQRLSSMLISQTKARTRIHGTFTLAVRASGRRSTRAWGKKGNKNSDKSSEAEDYRVNGNERVERELRSGDYRKTRIFSFQNLYAAADIKFRSYELKMEIAAMVTSSRGGNLKKIAITAGRELTEIARVSILGNSPSRLVPHSVSGDSKTAYRIRFCEFSGRSCIGYCFT